MQTLAKFLIHRGSLTAAAAHLDVEPSTLLRWKRREWTPSAGAKQRIDAMLSSLFFDVSAKKLRKLTEHFSEEKAPRNSHNGKFAAK